MTGNTNVQSLNSSLFVCDFRLQGLEKKILIEAGETPAVVYEMKKQVDSFREKLEVQTKNTSALKAACCIYYNDDTEP